MPYKDLVKQRTAQREYAQRNREKVNATTKRCRVIVKHWFVELKKTKECLLCLRKGVRILHFHHIRDKVAGVSALVCSGMRDAAIEEMKKCVVLCRDCHEKEHLQIDFGKPSLLIHLGVVYGKEYVSSS